MSSDTPPKPAKLLTLLDACMLSDQPRLARRIRGIQRAMHKGRNMDKALDEVSLALQKSGQRLQQRQQRLPQPQFDLALPVSERREAIAAAISANPVVIIAGATGSGKTTQLPKICLQLGRGVSGMIGCTQPRRIAAITVATRVAEELGGEVSGKGGGKLGSLVGYKTRFGARHSPDNLLRFMTDGILLAETQGDRQLRAYDTLIIDEVHERSLNIDLLLGYLKQLLRRRPELKLIISSATLDTERLSKFFDGAPVIEVEGRTYPVETRYSEPAREQDLAEAVADSVSDIARADRSGDVLVFFSGEREIREATEALSKRKLPHNAILPLYGRLSQAEQQRVFRGSNKQKVVLATNVAETSLTIPGIRYVVDTGLARIHRYSHRSQVSRLQVEPVSQASCNQRAGRCGRVGPGICIRLYAEDDYTQRPEFTDPEIQRSSLAEVILRMASLGLNDVERFPFVDPPPPRAIKEGYRVLEELGALAADGGLSDTGKQLARLPLDPRLGRMLVAASQTGCLEEVLAISAGLSIQDPRERPLDKQQTADQRHQAFADPQSDFLSLLNLWRAFMQQLSEGASRSAQRRWCRHNFLSYNRMLEWRDTHQQLEAVANQLDFHCSNPPADYAVIHCALMTGLLSRLGQLHEKNVYLGARQLHFHPFPGSVLFRKHPKWIMAGELVDTSRLYGRTLARIEVDWIEPLASHLLRRSYSDPHWEKKRSQVVAFENVTLLGLPIVNRRKTAYGHIDPKEARAIFIREGLVRGELSTHGTFMAHNLALMEEVEGLEQRARRRDILVDEETLAAFYEPLIPAEVNDGRRFERWRKLAEREHPRLLYMDREALMRHNAEAITRERFPPDIELQGGKLLLDYRFEPGQQDDGVNIDIPLARLAQLKPQQFEWLVPGLRQELFEALLRGLPKSLRRNFVPVPDYARRAVAELSPDDGPLLATLSRWLLRVSGVRIDPDQWDTGKLPEHLRANYRVLDEAGQAVQQGRDLTQLQDRLAERARSDFDRLPQGRWQRDPVSHWDFADLPEQVSLGQGAQAVLGFPSLIDHGDHVALTLLHEPEQARLQHHAGVRRLLALQLGKTYRQLGKSLPVDGASTLAYAHFGNSTALRRHIVDAAIERVCLAGRDPVRSQQEFQQRLDRGRSALTAATSALWNQVSPLLISRQQLAARLQQSASPHTADALKDLRSQLHWLFPPDFLLSVPDARLSHYRRYLKAIARRLDGLHSQPGRDAPRLAELAPFWRAVTDRIGKPGTPIDDAALEQLRWMVEEFRVSLFAQELGTAQPASAKRLSKLVNQLKQS